MVSDKQQQLVNTLKKLFMMDQADLNFGIYRIMNAKHDEIESFLTNDLLTSIRQTLQTTGKASDTKKELDDAINNAQALGMNPDESPKVEELKALLGNGAENSLENDENEIFSQLTTFFSRYYDGGDFMSLRRYKKETYSPLPMNGEEVKLHWANADQYYIKSAENFSQYAFKIGEENQQRHFRFELVAASTEQNNVKATEDKERRFILDESNPLAIKQTESGTELLIHFSYLADAKKRKQKDLNFAAINFLSKLEANNPLVEQITDWPTWQTALLTSTPTEKNKTRTALEKHLNDYSAKNSFDYFIHKDLGGFLRRELDFFIKNELLLLDDLVPSSIDTLQSQLLSNERSLKKVIAFKSIAEKLIAFLAQLENFQKKLWLKKKFVQESHYCMTLDRVPESFYQEIANNDKQAQELQSLGFTTENTNITVDFLKESPYLLIDTVFFSIEFKHKLLAEIEDLDESTDGLLIHSENFQALSLIGSGLNNSISNVFIDPPYNTGDDGFLYKDNYSSSSWLSMMNERIDLGMNILSDDGVFFASIGDEEQEHLSTLFRHKYDKKRFFANLIWEKKKKGSFLSGEIARMKDYILCVSKNTDKFSGLVGEIASDEATYPCVNASNPREVRKIQPGIISKYKETNYVLKAGKTISAGNMNLLLKSDLIIENNILTSELIIEGNWRYSQINMSNYAEKKELYITQDLYLRRIVKEPRFKRMKDLLPRQGSLKESDFRLYDVNDLNKYGWGTNEDANDELHQLLGEQYAASYPKPSKLLTLLLASSRHTTGYWLDYFAGSGTTAHAIINLNREDNGKRKYILVEIGDYFNTVLKPRIKKVAYSGSWKDGKPLADNEGNLNSISHCFKYLRLESYEDVQDNLQLQRTEQQFSLLDKPENLNLKEDYLLHYMLDIEAQDSLLSPELFTSPFNATMRVVRDNESRTQSIDLVETFNYLLGLRIKTYRHSKGIVEVTGKNPLDQQVLILWRDCVATDNDALDNWFKKQHYNSRDMEFDLIYVNGDNNLPNLRTGEETWKVQLIEQIFQTLMFDVKDV